MMCNERSDQEDEDEETAGSMNVRELELPATKPKVHAYTQYMYMACTMRTGFMISCDFNFPLPNTIGPS